MRAVAITALVMVGAACSPGGNTPVPTEVVNHELGITLAAIPDGFQVTANAGSRLELVPVAPDAEAPPSGRVWLQVGPGEDNVNLLAAVHEHQAFIEAQPGGVYKGAQELGTQLGPAFYSRGRFAEGDAEIEETVIFALHPRASRRFELHYRYPAGADSAARVTALIGVLAEVAPITPPTQS